MSIHAYKLIEGSGRSNNIQICSPFLKHVINTIAGFLKGYFHVFAILTSDLEVTVYSTFRVLPHFFHFSLPTNHF